MDLIHNEQMKLLATWLNSIGVASVAVGVLTPSAAFLYGLGNAPAFAATGTVGSIALVYLVIGAGLHYAARLVLRSLRS